MTAVRCLDLVAAGSVGRVPGASGWENGRMRILALDHGTVRCGCALSDPTGVLVRPLGAIRPDPAEVAEIVERNEVGRVVLGLPRTLAGEEGAQAALVREFAAVLEEELTVPVELFDERLTSRLAQRSGREGAEADIDSLAAAHLLESWIDANEVQRD